MKKLYWTWNTINFPELSKYRPELSDVIVPCRGKDSSWWQGLPSFTNGLKNLKEVSLSLASRNFSEMSERIGNDRDHKWTSSWPTENKTMKWCPGVTALFETAFLLKSPEDIMIHISRDMDFSVSRVTDSVVGIGGHQFDQLRSKNNLFRGKFNIKFTLPVTTMNTYNLPYVFLNPTYHAKPIWDVIPGVINKEYSKGIPLIVNTLVDVKDLDFVDDIATISVKKGDALSYIWYPEKMKLTESKKNFHMVPRSKF